MAQEEEPDKKVVKAISRKLASFAEETPQATMDLFERHLEDTQYSSKLTALIVRVAVRFGGAEGELLVQKIMNHPRVPVNFKSVAVMSLGMTTGLGPVGEKILAELVKNPPKDSKHQILQDQAIYTIANQERKRSDEGQWHRGVALLLDSIDKAQDMPQKVRLLRGLTNAGHPDVVDMVKPYLTDESNYIRVAAFEALRLNKTAEASDVFLEALVNEKQPFYVRHRVIDLIGELALADEHFEMVSTLMQKERKRTLLSQIILAVGRHGEAGRSFIEHYVDDDRDLIRKSALEALQGVTR